MNSIKYNQWITTNSRSTLETIVDAVDIFLEKFFNQLNTLYPHAWVAQQQSKFFRETKKNLKQGEFAIVVDFAENYAFVVQNAIQGTAYFTTFFFT